MVIHLAYSNNTISVVTNKVRAMCTFVIGYFFVVLWPTDPEEQTTKGVNIRILIVTENGGENAFFKEIIYDVMILTHRPPRAAVRPQRLCRYDGSSLCPIP